MKKLLLLAAVSFTSLAGADLDAYSTAAQGFCDKVKMCIQEEMQKESGGDIPPQLKAMVESMSEQMCARYMPDMMRPEIAEHEDLVEAGTACMEDMSEMRCDDFQDEKQPASCKQAEALANKYGLSSD